MMSITEGIPPERPSRPQLDIHSSDFVPALATEILSDYVGKTRKTWSGQPDAMSDGKLVYAVSNLTQAQETVSDELLLKSVAAGDKAAMHIMFARHRVRVFCFIQRIVCNPTIADDLVSQVFLDVWRSAATFENRARVSTWLLAIARFKAISALRERTYENIDKGEVLGVVDDADTPEMVHDRTETNAILRACIAKLSPAQREIIELVYYRETSVAEASEIVGIPYPTAKTRMFYARKQLARMLVAAGFEAAAAQTTIGERREMGPARGLHLKLGAGPSTI
jgi:RNA polymerase sigma-70 factor (ECF subfamily)